MHKNIDTDREINGFKIGDLVRVTACDLDYIINNHLLGKSAKKIYKNTGLDKFQIEDWHVNSYGEIVGVFLKYVHYSKNSSLKYKQQPFYFNQIEFSERLGEDRTLWDYYKEHKHKYDKMRPKMINF